MGHMYYGGLGALSAEEQHRQMQNDQDRFRHAAGLQAVAANNPTNRNRPQEPSEHSSDEMEDGSTVVTFSWVLRCLRLFVFGK